jgi:glycosyltransferase involved in cell wall biosynthesis
MRVSSISAVIPAYNHAHFIAFALDSILAQTRPPDEIFVIDDGSTDNTAAVVEQYGSRVKYVRQRNAGVGAARNLGVRLTSGDWIAFIDADDGWLPEKLSRQVEMLDARPEAVLVHTGSTIMEVDGRMIPLPLNLSGEKHWPLMRFMNPITMSSVMVSRRAYVDVGGFNERLTSCEDWDLWVRMHSPGRFVAVPEPLTIYRATAESMSTNPDRMIANMEIIRPTSLLRGLPSWVKPFWTRRIRAVAHYQASITARPKGRQVERGYLMRSIVQWPLPSRGLPARYRSVIRNLISASGG